MSDLLPVISTGMFVSQLTPKSIYDFKDDNRSNFVSCITENRPFPSSLVPLFQNECIGAKPFI